MLRLRQMHIMGHDNKGCALFIIFSEDIENVPFRILIQVTSRFIGQDDVGLIDKGPGNGYPSLLSAGKLGGKRIDFVLQADQFKNIEGTLMITPRRTAEGQGQQNILQGGQGRE